MMQSPPFTLHFSVDKTPVQVFAAINDVRGWWSMDLEGPTDREGEPFVFRHGGLHTSTQQVTELVPGTRVVWNVTQSELTFLKGARNAWDGTTVRFDLKPRGTGTEVTFTHEGLTPACECYRPCSDGWTFYLLESLVPFITEGRGRPGALLSP